MDKKKAFTLIELLVVISIIVILLGILIPVLGRTREFGRRTKCLSNLKQLQLAWIIYAEQNDDMIVNAGIDLKIDSGTNSASNPSWTGNDMNRAHTSLPSEIQIQAVRAGTLYPYVGNIKPYRCPNGFSEYMRTYSIVESMTKIADRPLDINDKDDDRKPIKIVKKRKVKRVRIIRIVRPKQTRTFDPNLIPKPKMIDNKLDIEDPSSQMVFADEGMPTDCFNVSFFKELWESVPSRHSTGNTFSFADGHAEFWQWLGEDTIAFSLSVNPRNIVWGRKPTTYEGLDDLHKTQMAVWGELGYEPTPTD
jgi:prepilin-type N-terminal cleavage/methylation domain-containing protein/prepilin-type processing-associated H-X9-DG protein